MLKAYRRRLCSIPYRRASYPIARCSCQNVIGGRNIDSIQGGRGQTMIYGLPDAIFFINIVYYIVATWFLHVRFSSISMLTDLEE